MATEIHDWNDLNNVRNNLSGNFILMNDLDESTEGYDTHASPTANGGNGWEPIGELNNYFTGTFDGQDNEIRDLYIDRISKDYVGLFGFGDDNHTIKNLSIKNCDITGNNFVGAIMGFANTGIIEKCISTGVIKGFEAVGGFCGINLRASITDCYSKADVDGNDLIGGFSGRNQNNGNINTSYSTGVVTASSDANNVGGFCGVDYGSILDCYWDVESSGQSTSNGGTGLTTSEMTGEDAESNMTGFDFENVWSTITDPDDYPGLNIFIVEIYTFDFTTTFMYSDDIQSAVFTDLKDILKTSLATGMIDGGGLDRGYILNNGTVVFDRELQNDISDQRVTANLTIFEGDFGDTDEFNEIELRDNDGNIIWSAELTDPRDDSQRRYIIKVEMVSE